jgi:adenylylsulfate kinase-like enzyme
VSDPYEAPESPELQVDTESMTPEESAELIHGKLAELGLVEDEVPA